MKPYLLCLTVLSLPAYAASELIELNYLATEQALTIAQQSLGEHGTAKVYGNHLLVTASAFRIRELRALLGSMDQAPKRLLISLDTRQSTQRESGFSTHYSTQRDGRLQQTQALEGQPVHFSTGQSQPINTLSYDAYGYPQRQTHYQNLQQGFSVTAHVIGDQVQLALHNQHDQRPSADAKSVHSQSLQTHLRTPLNQWVTVSSSEQVTIDNQGPYQKHYRSYAPAQTQLRIKVELLD